jgi:hypothetical protein
LLTVQGAELGHGNIQGCLGHSISRGLEYVGLECHLWVRHARGDGNDFLCPTFQDQGHENIEEMYSADGIDSEVFNQILFKGFWIGGPVE